ncbi:NAD(P)/FAD-dependent oxidoreductase [Marinibacterium sp. SX1]|uniref:NAD(P)/FAD-dependent oxidoreductase n=1 Tax=Marinibacterium sp. SX1 TaxID=3388424 RepID=UPI003D1811E5
MSDINAGTGATGEGTGNTADTDAGRDMGSAMGQDTGSALREDAGRPTGRATGQDAGQDTGGTTEHDTGHDGGRDAGSAMPGDTDSATARDTARDAGDADILVIGGGMAGASVAAMLAGSARVILLEAESQPGYHTTGRSAAMYEPTYGPRAMRALTRAGLDFFTNPPEIFGEGPLISPRASLFVAPEEERALLETTRDEVGRDQFEDLDAEAIRRAVPVLKAGYAVDGALNHGGSDIDVARMHQGFLRMLRAGGGTVATDARVEALTRDADGLWEARTRKGSWRAPVVVNAAGAWADQLGEMAGAEPIGLVPKRRTALIVAAPEGMDVQAWPLVVNAAETWYMKPDAGRLLISPANEDPQMPADAQPDELDVAICIDRVMTACDLDIRRVESQWAGLRSFVADKEPVAGWSDVVPGFYWLAGQGGYGIQSAPALARFAAAQLLGRPVPADIAAEGLDAAQLAPGRLAGAERFTG